MSAKFEWGHPNEGIKCRWGKLKWATFDKKLAITRKWYGIDAQFSIKFE